jgi:hypothetical protein
MAIEVWAERTGYGEEGRALEGLKVRSVEGETVGIRYYCGSGLG